GSPAVKQPVSVATARPVSSVAWTPEIIGRLRHPDEKKGAEIAANKCAPCHGETGVSPDAQFPHMAGQSAYAIYKQLNDFKNHARKNDLMEEVVKDLDDNEMVDVAAHYASMTKGALDRRIASSEDPDIYKLVEYGYTDRGLPACASCHGSHSGGPIDTPTLSGQRREYLFSQLEAFAKGERQNDVYKRMRAVAEKLRPEEMRTLADYYASQRLIRGAQ
ncbi:MAG: c-type cytochrome, partial [Methylocystis sp.]|nr:c-type cytochrome [Methylocystis sp.]